MGLAAVVSLVHEQVRQHMPGKVALDLAVAAVHRHLGVAAGGVEPVAEGDQALVARALPLGQRRQVVSRREGVVLCRQVAVAVQCADVVRVDREDVVQRLRQAREVARAWGVEVFTRQRGRRGMQAVIGQAIGARLDAQGGAQVHGESIAPTRRQTVLPATPPCRIVDGADPPRWPKPSVRRTFVLRN